MANQKITQLTALTNSNVDVADVLPIVDVSGSVTDKITYQNLMRPKDSVFGIVDSADITKIMAFELSGLTTATTRTLTVPDADLTLVGTTTTQTLTNKTLTAPQINMGSDATGDIYYRTGAGAFARLAIGSTLQILQVSAGGIPAWVSNPSASAASDTVAGVVELATTTETETGTDATRAVTPDGLHDMTTLTGAAWFLDEDTMSSDSATKTASQQSIKAYADTKATLADVPNTSATQTDWYSWTQPFLSYTASGPTETMVGFTSTITVGTNSKGGFGHKELSASSNGAALSEHLPGNGSNQYYTAASSKDIKFKWRMTQGVSGAGDYLGFGFADATTTLDDTETSTASGVRFVNNNGVIYASNGNGASNTNTNVDSGITDANWNTYEIVFNPGTDAKFYINGTLVATHTTNLPTGSLQYFGIGYTKATNNLTFYVSPITFSLEL